MREQSVGLHLPMAFLLLLGILKRTILCCVCPGRAVS